MLTIDRTNTILLLISAIGAFFLPFETFLFSYAFFGPLHYLTEISWLRNRSFFLISKKFIWLLLIIGIIMSAFVFGLYTFSTHQTHYTTIGFLLALAFTGALLYIKEWSKSQRWIISTIITITLICVLLFQSWAIFFTIFIPTIIHVSFFTILFMFQGAQKSQSKVGYFNVYFYFILSAILIFLTIKGNSYTISSYALEAYKSFEGVNLQIMNLFNIGNPNIQWSIYESSAGLSIMRFIAFAYTYHYLNWFSKVNVIKWNQIPRTHMTYLILAWIVAVGLYIADYRSGLALLYFLSLMHVLLEFPLNHHSILGIWSGFKKKS